jgi:hypothetical protein
MAYAKKNQILRRSMVEDSHENRRSRRHYFNPEENITGVFYIKELDKRVTLKIANICNGGLYFSSKRGQTIDHLKNSSIFLEEIKGRSALSFTDNIQLVIRWVLDKDVLQHVGFGCQFINLPKEIFKQIDSFVEAEVDNGK